MADTKKRGVMKREGVQKAGKRQDAVSNKKRSFKARSPERYEDSSVSLKKENLRVRRPTIQGRNLNILQGADIFSIAEEESRELAPELSGKLEIRDKKSSFAGRKNKLPCECVMKNRMKFNNYVEKVKEEHKEEVKEGKKLALKSVNKHSKNSSNNSSMSQDLSNKPTGHKKGKVEENKVKSVKLKPEIMKPSKMKIEEGDDRRFTKGGKGKLC